jgi:ABC-type glycerol-3-phosphate transport system substrate-binding protein
MKKTFKLFAALFVILILAACNGKTEKSVLPELTNKTKSEIELIFNDFKEDITLTFEFEYSNEIPENVFIKYKEPNKVGDTINNDDEIIIILASEKVYLPDLTGKNKTEIIDIFTNINTSLSPAVITLEFQYAYPLNNDEDLFISYLNNNIGDVILKDSTIEILVNSNYVTYPEIKNKTQQEVIDIFSTLFSPYNDIPYEIVYKD